MRWHHIAVNLRTFTCRSNLIGLAKCLSIALCRIFSLNCVVLCCIILHCVILVILASHGLCKGMLAAIFDLNLSGVFVPNISHHRNHDESLRNPTCCVYLQPQIDVPLSNMWIKKVWLMALSDHLSTSVIICYFRWPHTHSEDYLRWPNAHSENSHSLQLMRPAGTWEEFNPRIQKAILYQTHNCVLKKDSILEYRKQYYTKHTILSLGRIHMGWNNCVTTLLMQGPDRKNVS